MSVEYTEIRVRGKSVRVRCATVNGRLIVATGSCPKIARIHDEALVTTAFSEPPESLLSGVKRSNLQCDVLTFAQHLTQTAPMYDYQLEWDSVAAIPLTTYQDWLAERSTHLRRDLKKAVSAGVEVREAELDDAFVRGIVDIYSESPIRQGRPFWHYGKSFQDVKRETITYLEQSQFLGAYVGEELVGFLKVVHVDRVAQLMFILSKIAYQDRRPTNALIAKAVELCAARHSSHLTYGSFVYGSNGDTSLTAFKRRCGFIELRVPRYFVPLTLVGKICLLLHLHRGAKGIVPAWVQNAIRKARQKMNRKRYAVGSWYIVCDDADA